MRRCGGRRRGRGAHGRGGGEDGRGDRAARPGHREHEGERRAARRLVHPALLQGQAALAALPEPGLRARRLPEDHRPGQPTFPAYVPLSRSLCACFSHILWELVHQC